MKQIYDTWIESQGKTAISLEKNAVILGVRDIASNDMVGLTIMGSAEKSKHVSRTFYVVRDFDHFDDSGMRYIGSAHSENGWGHHVFEEEC